MVSVFAKSATGATNLLIPLISMWNKASEVYVDLRLLSQKVVPDSTLKRIFIRKL